MPLQKHDENLEFLSHESASHGGLSNTYACPKLSSAKIPKLSPECPRLEFGPPKGVAKKTKVVTVGIHGDEIAPLYALNELFQTGFLSNNWTRDHCLMYPFTGSNTNHLLDERIVFILGNPKAVSMNRRFVDVNLNRIFKPSLMSMETGDLFFKETHEMSRIQEIAMAIEECDEFLDLHSTSSPSPPFAIPGDSSHSRELAISLSVDFVIENLAKVIEGTTIDYANRLGKICCCVECGEHTNRKTIETAKELILQFISGDRTPRAKEVISCSSSQCLCKGFKFARDIHAFQRVDADELIATDDLGEIRCPFRDSYIIMPSSNHILGEEAWFWGVPKQ